MAIGWAMEKNQRGQINTGWRSASIAHHFEQGAARPDHHTCPEFSYRDTAQTQDMPGLMPRTQVGERSPVGSTSSPK